MAEGEEPGDYIDQRKDIHDCFFLVGSGKKERISTVRCFLANYSSYFRAMLLETDMREKKSKEDIVIPDHEPDVFRLMLSFVYGRHDIKFKNVNQAMRFHILVDKCLMPKLKKISTKYLMENCQSNLCEVLECAVLLDIKEMEPRAKKIVEKDTRALLSSPDFLNANPAIVEFIVKQDGLNVTEVELWRALVKWAQRQCENKREGSVLRRKIDSFFNCIQFLKMSLKEFAEDVVPTSILTPTETVTIFVQMATGKGNKIQEAASKTRHKWSCPLPSTYVVSLQFEGNHIAYPYIDIYFAPITYVWESGYEIKTSNLTQFRIKSIELSDITQTDNIGFVQPYYNGNLKVHVKLLKKNENRTVAALSNYNTNNMQLCQLPNILDLSDEWQMEASQVYTLCLRIDRSSISQWNSNAITSGGHYNSELYVKSCDLCTVRFIYSTHSLSGPSVIKSLAFSVVDV